MAQASNTITMPLPMLTIKVKTPPFYGLRMLAFSWLVGLAGKIGLHDIEVEIGDQPKVAEVDDNWDAAGAVNRHADPGEHLGVSPIEAVNRIARLVHEEHRYSCLLTHLRQLVPVLATIDLRSAADLVDDALMQEIEAGVAETEADIQRGARATGHRFDLNEGSIRKGGINRGPTQVEDRPAPPAPMTSPKPESER